MRYSKILLLALFAIQLAIPGYMIFEQNQILKQGKVYKFKTRPIDPYDPFRGRYVTLSYDINVEPVPSNETFNRGDWVYAILDKNDQDFAVFSELVSEEPESGKDFIELEVGWGDSERGYYVRVPFNRYYASEKTAPNIERAVWNRQEVENVYAQVSVLAGKATLKELYVNDMPIRDFLNKELHNKKDN
jgi:uncharacterized membrane-anchored protein